MIGEPTALTSYITYSTYLKYLVVAASIKSLQVRDKRGIFSTLRTEQSPDVFFPSHGVTAGCFCIFQVLLDNKRPRRREP